MPPAVLPQENSPWYPLYKRVGGSQSHSWCYGEKKNLFPHPRIKPQLLDHPAFSIVSILSYPNSFIIQTA
jgi:hypothetical protein